jgi:DNA-binding NarL/FixJ family response regulator
LTRSEVRVLRALWHGGSTSEIASDFAVSRETVRAHVRSILHKLAVHNRLQAVAIGLRRGLI